MAHSILAAVLILLQWQYSTSLLIQSSPSYTPVCPGDTVIFTCNSTTRIRWSLNSDGSNNVGYTAQFSMLGTQLQLGIFTLNLTSKTPNLTSTATVHNVTISQTGTDIYCSSDSNNYIEATVNVTILSSPIGLSVVVLNDSSVNITWSPPSQHCITQYIIRALSDTTDNITTYTSGTGTTLILSGLSSGNTYNFSVAGIDIRNITGIYSQHVIINLSVPNEVRNLINTINYTEWNTVNITVYWESPLSTYHPNISYYNIYHNISSNDIRHNITTLTYFTISNVPTGQTYFISVSAENVIGEGTNNTIYVDVPIITSTMITSIATSVDSTTTIALPSISTTSITPLATTTTMSPSMTSVTATANSFTSSITTTPTITSTSMPTTTSTPSSTAAIGTIAGAVGGGLAAVIILLVIISVVVICFCIKKKTSSKPKSNQYTGSSTADSQDRVIATSFRSEDKLLDSSMYSELSHTALPQKPVFNGTEGQYSVLNTDIDDEAPPPVPPYNPEIDNEYSVLKREDREKQKHIDMQHQQTAPTTLYSTLNQDQRNRDKGLVYAELGLHVDSEQRIAPLSHSNKPIIYSEVEKPPQVPKRLPPSAVQQKILASLDMELPPPRPPKPPYQM